MKDGHPEEGGEGAAAVPTDPLGAGGTPTRTHVGVASHLAPGTLVGGRYRIEEIVGVGGMGIVYRAHDLQLDLPTAVKVLRPEYARDPRFLERFRRELILARQVSHRNVVRIHDLGQDGELHFLTMDLVVGRSLRDVLEQEGALPLARAVRLAKQLARALAGAAAQGVVHRDLKPDNVLIDAEDNAYVTDFGIARSLGGAALTRTGMVVGTPNYLSPEQARGEEVDGRSDLYTLGLIFFEMLTDELPFRGGSDSEVLAQRIAAAPSFSLLEGVAPPQVVSVVRRLLERDAARRYPGAPELLADLDHVEGLDPTRRSRLAWLRRPATRTWWVAGGALAALALLALLLARSTHLPWPRRADRGATSAVATVPGHAVAVLPLRDETGRADLAWTGRGVAELLSTELGESRGLRVVESLRVFRTLDDLGLQPDTLASEQLASLADLFEADRLVTGSVRSLGAGLQLEARLVSPLPGGTARPAAGGTPPSGGPVRVTAASAADLASAVERLAGELARALAVEPGERQRRVVVPAAMSAYGQGRDRLVRGDALGAVTWLERATGADPALTAAWLRLSEAYQTLGREDEAVAAIERAAATLGEDGGRLATEVQARRAVLRGDAASADRLLGALAARYPHEVELLVLLGSVRGEAGHLETAQRALARATELDAKHPRAWYLRAKYAIQAGEARRAVDDYLVRAMVIQNQLGNDQGRADVLNALGVAYEHLGQLDQADEHYRKAAALREEIGDTRGFATTLRNLASLAAVRGEPEVAATQLAQARELLSTVGDRRGLADVHNDLGILAEERGDYRAALAAYRNALQMRQDLADRRGIAESHNNVGFAYYLLGEHDNAMVYWRQALDLYRREGNRHGSLRAQQSIGTLELAQGRWEQATRTLLASLEESRRLGLPDTTAVAQGGLGRLAHLQGRYPAALDAYSQALRIVGELDDQRGKVEFTLLAAETLLEVGDTTAAAERLATAERELAAGGSQEHRARLQLVRGRLALQEGRPAAAAEAFARAVELAEDSDIAVLVLEARAGAALAELALGGAPAAARELAAVTTAADQLGDLPLRLATRAALARAELARGQASRAAAVAREALAATPAGPPWGGSWRLHATLAAAAGRLGDDPTARLARERAAAELARLRQQLSPAQRQRFDSQAEVRALAPPAP